MMVAAVVEGFGDVSAFPALVARTGDWLGINLYSPRPIRAGEWASIKAKNSLDRHLELAISRNPDRIVVALDLDDGCPVAESAVAKEQIEKCLSGRAIPVSIIFMMREYESIFLHQAADINPSVNDIGCDPDAVRDAKGRVKAILGRRYNEPKDQPALTKMIDLKALYRKSRCYRKLCKEISGLTYDEINDLL